MAEHRTDEPRDADVALLGATGAVGRLVAQYLAEHAPPGTRVVLAGRSADRLAAVRAALPPAAAGWSLAHADLTDAGSLAALARSARVVATTAGPYAPRGLGLVQACAEAGTHYVDLTGEVLFVRASIDAWHTTAAATGARIVHACGFDSVPSDLAVLLAARQAAADGAGGLTAATLLVRSLAGGLGAGTIDSVRGQVDTLRERPDLRAVVEDPYGLSPDRPAEPEGPGARDRRRAFRHPAVGGWVAPFVMAPFNTRVVRRSNALQGWAYGRGLRYRELMVHGRGPAGAVAALAAAAGPVVAPALLAWPPTRAVLDRLLDSAATGPDAATQRPGRFRLEVHAATESGARYTVEVGADLDPAFRATAAMLAESALALVHDGDRLPDRAGVLTPATAVGAPLVDRLRDAGFRLGLPSPA
ncbi:saccharopine dehydrogenase NADP-binding domain-containing protein [Georgenia sp. TF02-10]|uniref:saccharopine dehydrogenase family protein n=1 Tax=Georgenia sp. TF02-10 TaxID=2917725 RepID=UPI001FA6DAC3|nr:saccharopine dehydrogenase NADP-binding domain-containing protein [Georgenia sp. TF02-10]UNX56211.1 saccharopine dehydrogenase NADP-binding domain-containing protein [Georgenia sp. TF02-10]